MRRATTALVACAGATLLLAGCGGAARASAGDAGVGAAARAEAAQRLAWQPAGEVVDEGLVGPIDLHIGGGFAGVDHGIEVAPDGSVVVSDRGVSQPASPLTEEELDQLEAAVAAVDFDALPAVSIDENSADLFIYELEYEGHALLTDLTAELGPVETVIGQLSGHLSDREHA